MTAPGDTIDRSANLPPADWVSDDGTIRLHCADCLDILPQLPAGCVDMSFSDPPYGHNNNNNDLIARRESALGRGEDGGARPIENDGFDDANRNFRFMVDQMPRLLAAGCCCCCCCGGGGGPDPQFARWSLWLDGPLDFKQMIVWDKGPMGMGWHYRRSYETVLVAQKRGAACRWFDTSSRVENIIRPGHGIAKIIPRADQHPTQKPTELAAHFIRLHTESGHVVLDPFLGSGTTAVACVRTGRRCIGIEIERRYFDIAVRRVQEAFDDQALYRQAEPQHEQLTLMEPT